MARNIFITLEYDNDGTRTLIIPASTVCAIDIDLIDIHNAQFVIEGTYAASDGGGLSCNIHYGTGVADPTAVGKTIKCVPLGTTNENIHISSNSDSVTMATYDISASPQTESSFFSTSDLLERLPRWIRLNISNEDAVNSCTVKIFMDV